MEHVMKSFTWCRIWMSRRCGHWRARSNTPTGGHEHSNSELLVVLRWLREGTDAGVGPSKWWCGSHGFLWDLRARARAPPHNFGLISVQVIRWHWEELLFTEEFIHQSKMPTGTFCPWFWVYVRWHIFLLYFYVAHVELVLQTYFLTVKNYGLKVPVITFPVMYAPYKMPIMCPWF